MYSVIPSFIHARRGLAPINAFPSFLAAGWANVNRGERSIPLDTGGALPARLLRIEAAAPSHVEGSAEPEAEPNHFQLRLFPQRGEDSDRLLAVAPESHFQQTVHLPEE